MEMQIKRTAEGSETWDYDGNVTSSEIKYLVLFPTTKMAAMQACFDDAPESNGKLKKSGVRFDGISGDGCYEISVLYDEDEQPSGEYSSGPGSDYISQFSFDCGGGTRHITHSKDQQILDGDLDPGGAIGWNGKPGSESQIAGVDIPAAQPRESYTRVLPFKKLTTAFRRKAASIVGSVNSTPFKGWEPGEVMFLGCTFNVNLQNSKETDAVSVTYNFAIAMNEDKIILNGKTYHSKKKGHQYIWTISETVVKQDEPPSLEIKGIYLETLCPEIDFNELGLGR